METDPETVTPQCPECRHALNEHVLIQTGDNNVLVCQAPQCACVEISSGARRTGERPAGTRCCTTTDAVRRVTSPNSAASTVVRGAPPTTHFAGSSGGGARAFEDAYSTTQDPSGTATTTQRSTPSDLASDGDRLRVPQGSDTRHSTNRTVEHTDTTTTITIHRHDLGDGVICYEALLDGDVVWSGLGSRPVHGLVRTLDTIAKHAHADRAHRDGSALELELIARYRSEAVRPERMYWVAPGSAASHVASPSPGRQAGSTRSVAARRSRNPVRLRRRARPGRRHRTSVPRRRRPRRRRA